MACGRVIAQLTPIRDNISMGRHVYVCNWALGNFIGGVVSIRVYGELILYGGIYPSPEVYIDLSFQKHSLILFE